MVMPGDNVELQIELITAGGHGEGTALRDSREAAGPWARERSRKSSSEP